MVFGSQRCEGVHSTTGIQQIMNLEKHLKRQQDFTVKTFGPGERTTGILKHIEDELKEVAQAPNDISEWIDIVILAFDGAMRVGFTPQQLENALEAKQTKNEGRTWPDWRDVPHGEPIQHVKEI